MLFRWAFFTDRFRWVTTLKMASRPEPNGQMIDLLQLKVFILRSELCFKKEYVGSNDCQRTTQSK